MATGTRGGLLETEATQSLVKHRILKGYLPAFTHKLGLSGAKLPVTLVDGYAGVGRYPTGDPASGELLLQVAMSDLVQTKVELVEKDSQSYGRLEQVAQEYRAKKDGLEVRTTCGEIERHWDEILTRAAGTHMFMFLDPCGAGVSFDRLVRLVKQERPSGWGNPRTEVLLNFNADLVRRMAGAAVADSTKEYRALNAVCGGDWWIDVARTAREEDASSWFLPLQQIVDGYIERLGDATGYGVVSIPVRADVGQQPKFYLVFMTASDHGVWEFSDSVAKATREWFDAVEDKRTGGQVGLFAPTVEDVHNVIYGGDARKVVRDNLLHLVAPGHPVGPLVKRSGDVLGDAVGAVTKKEIGVVVRKMEKDGELTIVEKGQRGVDDYVVQAVRA